MIKQEQIEIAFEAPSLTRSEFGAFLNDGARAPISVKFTRNRVTMLSASFAVDGIDLRLHQSFLAAPLAIRKALRTYLRTRRKAAWREVSAFADCIDSERSRPGRRLRSAGKVFNLEQIRKEINMEFFNDRVKCQVGWGKRAPRRQRWRRRKSISYGSWNAATRTVRVNPLLDSESIPVEFIRYIVFHEMLHSVVPDERTRSRINYHTAQFRKLEHAFPDLSRMRALGDRLINVL